MKRPEFLAPKKPVVRGTHIHTWTKAYRQSPKGKILIHVCTGCKKEQAYDVE